MVYSDKVNDYYAHPRNAGSFNKNDPAVGTGMVGTPTHGEVIKLQIKVNAATGVIDEARFKTFGSCSAIAASSLLSEWACGKTLEAAAAIRHSEIALALDLPPLKIHSSILAEDALKAAIHDYRSRQTAAFPQ